VHNFKGRRLAVSMNWTDRPFAHCACWSTQ